MTTDQIPTEITKLTYRRTGELIAAGLPVLSQNQTAEFLAHFWPAIEQHILTEAAGSIRERAARLDQAIDAKHITNVIRLVASFLDPEIASVPFELLLKVAQDAARTTRES